MNGTEIISARLLVWTIWLTLTKKEVEKCRTAGVPFASLVRMLFNLVFFFKVARKQTNKRYCVSEAYSVGHVRGTRGRERATSKRLMKGHMSLVRDRDSGRACVWIPGVQSMITEGERRLDWILKRDFSRRNSTRLRDRTLPAKKSNETKKGNQ